MNEPTQDSPERRQPSRGTLTALFEPLSAVVQRLRKQSFLFVVGVGILIVIAFTASWVLETFTPLYVTIIALVVLTLAALGAETAMSRLSLKPGDERIRARTGIRGAQDALETDGIPEEACVSQFDKLRHWLDSLVDTEFRDMIQSLLSPEQIHVVGSIDKIPRGDFLGAMRTWNRLDKVEEYLRKHFPDRFSCQGKECES